MKTAWVVAAALTLTALALEYLGGDARVLDAFYDPAAGVFPLAGSWWTNEVLHEGGRALVKTVAVAALLLWLAGLAVARLRPARRAALYLLASIALGCGLVNTGKALSNVDCPWSLERYGGERPYVHRFAERPDGLPRARCFPAGHAAGGYSLLSLYFVALALGWRRPRQWLLPGLTLGVVFGVDQWLRGAHFPSHDLWAAAVCWLVASTLLQLGFAGRLRVAGVHPAPRAGLPGGDLLAGVRRAGRGWLGDRRPPGPRVTTPDPRPAVARRLSQPVAGRRSP